MEYVIRVDRTVCTRQTKAAAAVGVTPTVEEDDSKVLPSTVQQVNDLVVATVAACQNMKLNVRLHHHLLAKSPHHLIIQINYYIIV